MPNIIFKCFDQYSLVSGVEYPNINIPYFFLLLMKFKFTLMINIFKNLRTQDLNLKEKIKKNEFSYFPYLFKTHFGITKEI